MYLRGYFHSRSRIGQEPIANIKVLFASIGVDALASCESTFNLISIPSAVEIGDVFTLYDQYGSSLYSGVVKFKESNAIECRQIVSLFDDNWLYKRTQPGTIEQEIKNAILDRFVNSNDPILKETFGAFDIKITSKTTGGIGKQDSDYVTNFESFLYDCFLKYEVKTDIVIPFKGKPYISIGKVNLPEIKIGDNVHSIQNISPVEEIYEVNKLVVYGEENKEYRGTFYGSRNGITENANELTRFNVVKTNYAFSDDPIALVKAQNLRNEMYNHKLTLDLVLTNRLYDFFSFQLGQKFKVFNNNTFYETILTGYNFECGETQEMEVVTLMFGKVRLKASIRW